MAVDWKSANSVVFVFNGLKDRDAFATCLHRRSGVFCDTRVPIKRDWKLRGEVKAKTGAERRLAVVAARSKGSGDVNLFVLTSKQLVSFKLQPECWTGLREAPETMSADEDDIVFPCFNDSMYSHSMLSELSLPDSDSYQSLSPYTLLSVIASYELPPKKIILLDFEFKFEFTSGELTMQFFDDSGREKWRLALAKLLSKQD